MMDMLGLLLCHVNLIRPVLGYATHLGIPWGKWETILCSSLAKEQIPYIEDDVPPPSVQTVSDTAVTP